MCQIRSHGRRRRRRRRQQQRKRNTKGAVPERSYCLIHLLCCLLFLKERIKNKKKTPKWITVWEEETRGSSLWFRRHCDNDEPPQPPPMLSPCVCVSVSVSAVESSSSSSSLFLVCVCVWTTGCSSSKWRHPIRRRRLIQPLHSWHCTVAWARAPAAAGGRRRVVSSFSKRKKKVCRLQLEAKANDEARPSKAITDDSTLLPPSFHCAKGIGARQVVTWHHTSPYAVRDQGKTISISVSSPLLLLLLLLLLLFLFNTS